MAKMISEITVGLTAKEIVPIGFVLINKAGKPCSGRHIYTSYGAANRVRIDAGVTLEVKRVYIEKCER